MEIAGIAQNQIYCNHCHFNDTDNPLYISVEIIQDHPLSSKISIKCGNCGARTDVWRDAIDGRLIRILVEPPDNPNFPADIPF